MFHRVGVDPRTCLPCLTGNPQSGKVYGNIRCSNLFGWLPELEERDRIGPCGV